MIFHVRGSTVRRKMTLLGAFVFPPFENRKGWGTQIRVIRGKNKTSRLGHPARTSPPEEGMLTMEIASRQRRALVALSLITLIYCAMVFVGCDSADYTILKNVVSPDNSFSALLVRRRGHDSLSNDVYYALLAKGHQPIPSLRRAIHDNPVLVATRAQDIVLRWSGPNTVDLICERCGIEKIDVIEKREKWNSVNVVFIGFPN